jgi:hypothetical protein
MLKSYKLWISSRVNEVRVAFYIYIYIYIYIYEGEKLAINGKMMAKIKTGNKRHLVY